MKRSLLMFIIAVVVTVSAPAEESVCKDKETPKDCFARFGAEWARKTNATSAAQTAVSRTNTGIANLTSSSQSTAKDFLSMLAAALIVPMSGDGSRPLAVDFNVPVPVFGEQRLKLQAVLARPELSPEVKQRLASNAAAMTAMKDSLSELDDVTVSGTLDPSTLRLGRSITPHRDAYQAMLDARFRTETPAAMGTPEQLRTAADDLISDFAGKFALLLNNQPQLYGSVLYRARRNVAGPNERSARVTYEMGFRNLNRFYKRSRTCRTLTDANATECAELLDAFAGTTAENDSADRVAMSVEYRSSNGLTVALPEYALHLDVSRAHSFVYSLAYGRNNMMIKKGRIDLAVNYEDTTVSEAADVIANEAVTGGPKAVRDRFVASATYTYMINDTMAMPLSLVYANHAAFLGDVDRRLNAHIGVTFKMPAR